MNRSIAGCSTRIRERAQQSWPALANIAPGAAAAARSRSASAKITLADLPPSSSVTRLIVCAAPAAIDAPTSVEPVNAIFATSGCSTSRVPHLRPGPTTTLTTPVRHARLEREPLEAHRGQRRQLSRLEHDRVARGQGGCELPRRDRQREVPRRDQPDDAERLAERHRDAAGHRDRVAEVALDATGVVPECLGDHPDLAARVADGCRRCAPPAWRAPRGGPPPARRRAGAGAPVARGDRRPGREGGFRAGDRRIDLLDTCARDRLEHALRGGLENLQRVGHGLTGRPAPAPERRQARHRARRSCAAGR